MIQEVSKALLSPIVNRYRIKQLVLELCNYQMNMNCGACITEAVMLLSNWLKEQGVSNEYKSKAIKGEYELKRINLFVQVYQSGNEKRQKELDACLQINKSLNINGVPFFNIVEVNERLTFNQMFKLFIPNEINIIANSDIYFDETILQVRWIQNKECYALSRWDYYNERAVLHNRKDSQDVWVFNGLVAENIGNYNLGVAGCDNKIAYELHTNGYKITNPSKTIHSIHLHETNYRTYHAKDRLLEPYHFIFPHH